MIVNAKSIVALIFTLIGMFFTIVPLNIWKIKLTYATVPPIVTLVLLVSTCLPFDVLVRGLLGPLAPDKYKDETSISNLVPLYVLLLFFGLAYACVSADHSGLFKLIATQFKNLAVRSKNQQLVGLLLFYLFAGIFTLCTSNDIVILCLTPIILEFLEQTQGGYAMIPLLICQFSSANTFSISLLTGNPSNFILTQIFGINFIQYLRPMLLVGIAAGLVVLVYSVILLQVKFKRAKKSINHQVPMENALNIQENLLEEDTTTTQTDLFTKEKKPLKQEEKLQKTSELPLCKFNVVYSAVLLVLMFFAFMFSSFIQEAVPDFDLSFIALIAGMLQLIKDIVLQLQHKIIIMQVIKGLPWAIPLFLMSMFLLVENAINIGLISDLSGLLFKLVGNRNVFLFSFTSSLLMVICCLLCNNLPATIIVSRILNDKIFHSLPYLKAGAFAAAAASNYGALFLPHCSLAGLMWKALVNKPDIMKELWLHGSCIGLTLLIICSLLVYGVWQW